MGGNTYFGTSKLKKCFVGASKVKKIYMGTNVIFAGNPEFTIGGVTYNPESFPYYQTITSASTLRFSSFDSSSFKLTAYLIGAGGGGALVWFSTGSYAERDNVGGGGGTGGEIITLTPTIVEDTDYSLTIGAAGTAESCSGGNTTGFGSTARGGVGATQANTGYGATAENRCSGGRGGHSYMDAWAGSHFDRNPSAGATGTTINGTVYGSGGPGGVTYGGTKINPSSAYGSGGMGGWIEGSVEYQQESFSPPTYGIQGAVILKIEEL